VPRNDKMLLTNFGDYDFESSLGRFLVPRNDKMLLTNFGDYDYGSGLVRLL
jgi:hypothetical protein